MTYVVRAKASHASKALAAAKTTSVNARLEAKIAALSDLIAKSCSD
jgi:hypothetical protein